MILIQLISCINRRWKWIKEIINKQTIATNTSNPSLEVVGAMGERLDEVVGTGDGVGLSERERKVGVNDTVNC